MDQAAAGEQIIIARAGQPVAPLALLAEPAAKRVLGQFTVSQDFSEPLPDDLLDLFERRE